MDVTVSHETILASQENLRHTLDAHISNVHASHQTMLINMAQIDTKLSYIEKAHNEGRVWVERIDERLKTIEKTENKRSGERGLMDYIVRTPLIVWIAAATVAAVAWFQGRF